MTDALKHCNDPRWLSQYSPLATPYFLSQQLQQTPDSDTPLGRGRALQHVLFQAADSLWPGVLPQSQKSLLSLVDQERAEEAVGLRYQFLLLDLRYLRRFFNPSAAPNTVGAMYDMLNVSGTRFFAHLQEARNNLAAALLRRIHPSLRLELPLPPLLNRPRGPVAAGARRFAGSPIGHDKRRGGRRQNLRLRPCSPELALSSRLLAHLSPGAE